MTECSSNELSRVSGVRVLGRGRTDCSSNRGSEWVSVRMHRGVKALKLLREVYITGRKAFSAEGTAYTEALRLGIDEIFKDGKCGCDKVNRR